MQAPYSEPLPSDQQLRGNVGTEVLSLSPQSNFLTDHVSTGSLLGCPWDLVATCNWAYKPTYNRGNL